jgi:hypothetical protein
MVLDLLLIGLAITLEPFPVTGFILLLTAERGPIKGLAFILGWLACRSRSSRWSSWSPGTSRRPRSPPSRPR